MTLTQAFDESVDDRPDTPALVIANNRLTYGQLDNLAAEMTGDLRDAGVSKGDSVWCNSRDITLRLSGLLACARTGSIFVDPDVTWSPQIRAWAWAAVRPGAVFLDGPDGPVKKIGSGIRRASDYVSPGANPNPDDPLDIKATSGTTGEPKFSIRTHANHLHAIHADNTFAIGKGTTVALFGPAFTAAAATTIGCGATLVLPTTSHTEPFLEAARDAGANWLMVPVAFLKQWVASDTPRPRIDGFEGILAYAGFVPPSIRATIDDAANLQLLTTYSMTEAPWCAFQRGLASEPADCSGHATEGVEIEVRDVDSAGLGDIYIRGPNVSPGYLTDRPRSPNSWFATGDVGRISTEGHLYVHGRARELIHVADHRISPHAVEAVIGQFSGVRDVAVFGTHDNTEVAAAVVTEKGDQTALDKHCHTHLEIHEIPRQWFFLDELPVSPSGKPDRMALHHQDRTSETLSSQHR